MKTVPEQWTRRRFEGADAPGAFRNRQVTAEDGVCHVTPAWRSSTRSGHMTPRSTGHQVYVSGLYLESF